MTFFQLFTDFGYFPWKNFFPKVAGHGQNREKKKKKHLLKGGVDGFNYFH
jgi:hypothetical protein